MNSKLERSPYDLSIRSVAMPATTPIPHNRQPLDLKRLYLSIELTFLTLVLLPPLALAQGEDDQHKSLLQAAIQHVSAEYGISEIDLIVASVGDFRLTETQTRLVRYKFIDRTNAQPYSVSLSIEGDVVDGDQLLETELAARRAHWGAFTPESYAIIHALSDDALVVDVVLWPRSITQPPDFRTAGSPELTKEEFATETLFPLLVRFESELPAVEVRRHWASLAVSAKVTVAQAKQLATWIEIGVIETAPSIELLYTFDAKATSADLCHALSTLGTGATGLGSRVGYMEFSHYNPSAVTGLPQAVIVRNTRGCPH